MCSDTELLHDFITLKGFKKTGTQADEIKFEGEDPTLHGIRLQAIIECRGDLIHELISLDWNEISDVMNKAIFIKTIVKKYLMAGGATTMENKSFITIYNIFQSKIVDAADILYYLNPLKFPGYEAAAMGEMRIDPSLDYSGFISACKVKRISDSVILDFIGRISRNTIESNAGLAQSHHRKYEKIIARTQKPRCGL